MTKPLFRRSVLAAAVSLALALVGTQAKAAGFQIQEQSASGLGLAYAGQAAAVHDASTAFWNPAGQALLRGTQGASAMALIHPSSRFRDDGRSTYSALGSGGQGGEAAWVPAMYGSWLIAPRWSAGFAINAPYGLATEWDSTWAGQFHAVRSEIKTLNLNPTLAFRVNEQLALGAGVSYQQIKAELTNRAVLVPVFPASAVGTGKVSGDDWAWGFNLGALMDFGQGSRVGMTYRSAIKYRIEGDLSFSGFPAAVPSRPIGADVKLPELVSVGLSHQFNPSTRLLADWTWTGWHSIPELRITETASGTTVSNTTLGFRNSWRAGLGVEYTVAPPWLLRAGVAFDKTPIQDAYRTPRLPDENKVWLALGARYTPSPNARWWIDVGYSYIWVNDASSGLPFAGASASESARGVLSGSYSGHVNILAAQAGFRF